MKITNRFKKLFALFFVLAVIIPLTSSFGVWDMLADAEDTYATGNEISANVVSDVVSEDVTTGNGETIDAGSVKYKFSLGKDEDIYNYDAEFSFNGVTYNGVFRNDIKATSDNTKLKVQDLGTLENPYVVLEITPEASLSTIRPHVGNLNNFDMTQEELDAIKLTEDEKLVVRMQYIESIISVYNIEYADEMEAELAGIEEQLRNELKDTLIQEALALGYTESWQIDNYVNDWAVWNAPDGRFQTMLKEARNKIKIDLIALLEGRTGSDTVSVEPILQTAEEFIYSKGIKTAESYDKELQLKYKYAEKYKKDYYQSVTLNKLKTNANYNYNLEYVTRYEVDADGNFAIYRDGDTKTVTTTTSTMTTKAIANEVKLTDSVINPLALFNNLSYGDSNNKLIVHNDTFTKGCLNTGYNSVMSETGVVLSETPYIDEYIFAGWSVKIGDDFVNINSLDDDYSLVENNITQLYTNWIVRYYEQDNYEILTTAGYVSVDFDSEDASYTVMLPDCIASKQEGFHHYKNQLTMCLAKKNRFIYSRNNGNAFKNLYETEEICYSEEISSWDFEFKKADYSTVADLKKVAPKLMPDTDYYVATKNAVYENGVVTYYPYNVLVITATPEELNKMVYYDAVYNGKDDSVGYAKSEYLNTFLDSVDFVFFSNGGASLEFSGNTFGKATVNHPSFATDVTIERPPVRNRNPLIYEDGSKPFDIDNVDISGSYSGTYASVVDLEWQICEKIYQRVAEPKDFAQSGKGQSRSMVVVFDESLGDKVAGLIGAAGALVNSSGEYINGTADNLAKLILMFFGFKNPTIMYDWYVDTEYFEDLNGSVIRWDKIKGAPRTVEQVGKNPEAASSFTGVVYGYEQWNSELFFPFEYFGVDHATALISGPDSPANKYNPWNSNSNFELFNTMGLARNVDFKKIASPYAYTFNGDNSAASQFFDYTIPEIYNPTNGMDFAPSGSTDLAFEFFRRVNPYKIRNEMISTKDAIKFMIANAQNASIITAKDIVILNKAEDKTRFTYSGYTMYVDTVIADDFNKLAENIEYKYVTESEGFCVPEVLWTQQYSDYTSNLLGASHWYKIFTEYPDDSPLKWYKVPLELENADKNNYFITYNIESVAGKDDAGNDVTVRTLTKNKSLYKYFDNNDNLVTTDQPYIEQKSEYYLEALLKPTINGKVWDQRTYMIAVKHYNSYKDFLAGATPESITVKPVVIEKLRYLFNLD